MESQAAILVLVIAGIIAAFWAFKHTPNNNESDRSTQTTNRKQRKPKKRDDYVTDVYLNRRFGKRK